MNEQAPLHCFFGHHKGATTWVRAIIKRACEVTGERWAVFDHSSQFGGNLRGTIRARKLGFVAYTNANIRFVRELPPYRAFHVVRDPRDTLVSAYYSHRRSHPTEGWPALLEHREKLNALSLEEGLLAEMDFSASVFEDMATWDYDQENVLELRFEDLVENPYQVMLDAFSFLDLIDEAPLSARKAAVLILNRATRFLAGRVCGRLRPVGRLPRVPASELLGIAFENRFSRLSGGRQRGEELVSSHYRKGQPGDWRNHFTDRVQRAFDERHRKLIRRIGYDG